MINSARKTWGLTYLAVLVTLLLGRVGQMDEEFVCGDDDDDDDDDDDADDDEANDSDDE